MSTPEKKARSEKDPAAFRSDYWLQKVKRAERTWILLHPDLDVPQRGDARDFLDGDMTVVPDMVTRRLLFMHLEAAHRAYRNHCRELQDRLAALPQRGAPYERPASLDAKRAERETRTRRLRVELGLCTKCGEPAGPPKRAGKQGRPPRGRTCDKCREKARAKWRRQRQ